MIWVLVGCPHSEIWDEGILRGLKARAIPHGIRHVKEFTSIPLGPQDILIGRLNESSPISKEEYLRRVELIRWSWPEAKAMYYYDDKARQATFFSENGYPHPETIYALDQHQAAAWLASSGLQFPVVAKGIAGSSSKNVRLVVSLAEVEFPCLLQEYCRNDGDYRYTVIGQRVFACHRLNRPGDFRASGSGTVESLSSLDPDCVRLVRRICNDHGFTTMAFDIARDNRGEWTIFEMSYTYPVYSVMQFSRHCVYGDEIEYAGFDPPDLLVGTMFASLL